MQDNISPEEFLKGYHILNPRRVVSSEVVEEDIPTSRVISSEVVPEEPPKIERAPVDDSRIVELERRNQELARTVKRLETKLAKLDYLEHVARRMELFIDTRYTPQERMTEKLFFQKK